MNFTLLKTRLSELGDYLTQDNLTVAILRQHNKDLISAFQLTGLEDISKDDPDDVIAVASAVNKCGINLICLIKHPQSKIVQALTLAMAHYSLMEIDLCEN